MIRISALCVPMLVGAACAAAVPANSVDIQVDLSAGKLPKACLAETGDWTAKGGELRQRDSHEHPARIFFSTPCLTDFEFSAEFKIAPTTTGVRSADFVFRAGDTTNYYYFHCNSQIDMVAFARANDASYWTEPKRFRKVGVTPAVWHTARVTGQGGEFVFYLDGKKVGHTADAALAAGCLGLGSCSAQVAFRNIRIRGVRASDAAPFHQGSSRFIRVLPGPDTGQPLWAPSLVRLPDSALLLAVSTAVDGRIAETRHAGEVEILRSEDGGVTWRQLVHVPGSDGARVPVLSVDGASVVCTWRAAGGKQVLQARSADDGHTWTRPTALPGDNREGPASAMIRDARGRLAVTHDIHIRRLPTGAKDWTTNREPLWPGKMPFLLRCANGDVLLFVTSGERGLHVLRSFDLGETWQGPTIVCGIGHGPVGAVELEDGSVLVAYARQKPSSLTVSRLDLRGPQSMPVPVGRPLPKTPAGAPFSLTGAVVVAPAVPVVNPRNTEGSIVQLKDGRLLLAYSRFYGGGGDNAMADISGTLSSDGGQSWGRPFLLQRNDAGCNVMSASLLRLWSGKLLLGYLRKNSTTDCRYCVRFSADEGRTWGGEIMATPQPIEYYVVNNDRVIQLRTGRLLVPAADHADWRRHNAWAVCYLSDDSGQTWRRGKKHVELPGIGCQEPGVVELRDGRVMMNIRNSLGTVYKAVSADGGETWSKPVSTGLAAPASPSIVRRIPETGDLLMIWNHSKTSRRVPLTAAVSTDDGETWTHIRDIETQGASFAYTSICFVDRTVVLSYWNAIPGHSGLSLEVRRLPVDWFYEK